MIPRTLLNAEDAPPLYTVQCEDNAVVVILHDEDDYRFRLPTLVAAWLGRDLTACVRMQSVYDTDATPRPNERSI